MHHSWWTADHVLNILNGVLAVASVATAIVAVMTIKGSNRVAKASETQATATTDAVKLTEAGLRASIQPIIVDVPLFTYTDAGGNDPGHSLTGAKTIRTKYIFLFPSATSDLDRPSCTMLCFVLYVATLCGLP